jgi:glycine/serine hydroxymethyltransferase
MSDSLDPTGRPRPEVHAAIGRELARSTLEMIASENFAPTRLCRRRARC